MAKSIALLLGVHAHQPVGNFSFVVDDAHKRCYRPFIQTLYKFPEFKFSVHFSGWLLDYLVDHFPSDIMLLKEMTQRGQVEIFGGGESEPVLAAIPNRDRIGQIFALSHKLEHALGQRPNGAWLTERVWESTVVAPLSDAGIRYVTVDDYHFLCTGKQLAELNGFFSTEEDGRRLDLFPISEALRYRIPFAPAHDVVNYLESLADGGLQKAAIYFDDIEKFGIWPDTFKWVYEEKWLEKFITGVLESSIIKPALYRDYHGRNRTRGVVYLPTTSYVEMNEWSLPAPAAHDYADLTRHIKEINQFDRYKAYLRGGIWRNFLSRYPESNWMHKRMLDLSHRFAGLAVHHQTDDMRSLLYQSQANDAYWHGLFGGLYLPHLRRAIYHAMVELESLLDKILPRDHLMRRDADLDGVEEIFLHNRYIQAVVRADQHAGIIEFDSYPLKHNFADTLSRRAEHYHRNIRINQDAHPEHRPAEGIASPHDRVSYKDVIRPEDLAIDKRPRALFLDSWISDANPETEPAYIQQFFSHDSIHFFAMLDTVEINKTIRIDESRLKIKYAFKGKGSGYFKTEINLAMPSCDGPAGYLMHAGRIIGGFGHVHELRDIRQLNFIDEVLGGKLIMHTSAPTQVSTQPYYTVSNSEAGFEKIMQAITITLMWHIVETETELVIELQPLN